LNPVRDGIFIEARPKIHFCFFGGAAAGLRYFVHPERPHRRKNKKDESLGCSFYKDAIPNGISGIGF
jgi:hypothetical protein